MCEELRPGLSVLLGRMRGESNGRFILFSTTPKCGIIQWKAYGIGSIAESSIQVSPVGASRQGDVKLKKSKKSKQ